MLDSLIEERKKKLERIKERGLNPYPARVERDFSISEAIKDFSKLSLEEKKVALIGRVKSIRDQGGVIFADLGDESGTIQLVLKKDLLPDIDFWRENLDRGDFVSASGKLFETKRGEKSLEVSVFKMAVKSLRPTPSEFYGLQDAELRLRERYVDLLVNPEIREIFKKKSLFWKTVRDFMNQHEFLEVETPVLEAVPGGAEAEPFVTKHNALQTEFYLRISLEISLKKLLVGGFDKVFEIGRIFRNEGIDAEHLQDYTQMEFYWAYADYKKVMEYVMEMYKFVIEKTIGSLVMERNGEKINWEGEWPTVDYYEVFKENAGLDLKYATEEELASKAKELGIEIGKQHSRGRLIDLIFKKTARPRLIQPCFLMDPPVDIEPLAKRKEGEPDKVERFQIIACGTELGKGFSEANDPSDERERFEEQMGLRQKGDVEAQMLDEDFLNALEYGMPPTGGFGMSERLFAVLMNKPVRETVFFPLLKRKG
ncbi:MAG: lysine--tRNA ligase [Patescibacteria group bacterium]|nr:lysine--tRNA ligase [Patescibacteria group bacterium]